MRSFEYAAPNSLKEATALRTVNAWGPIEVMAGGTDFVTCLKQGILAPDIVVSLKNVKELRGIRVADGWIHIGATTTLAELAGHKAVRAKFPSLVTAITDIGSPQIINVGTVGGDLCQRPRCWYYRNGYGLFARQGGVSLVREGDNRYHAIFGTKGEALFVCPSSLGPALVALDAVIVAEGPAGRPREIPAVEFFRTPKTEKERETALQPNEIITSIQVPDKGLRNATYEVRHRHGLDWPYVTASVAFRLDRGMVSDARVVLGHVAPVPRVARDAASVLNGFRAEAAIAARAGEAATRGAQPLSRNAYKVQLVKTAVKRALLAAAA
jgi:xanthine dehydrogenase YagS FAD-binding subunit